MDRTPKETDRGVDLQRLIAAPPIVRGPQAGTSVYVYDARDGVSADEKAALHHPLSDAERARADTIRHSPRRDAYIVGRALLRHHLSATVGGAVRPFAWRIEPASGSKPECAGPAPATPQFNLSYSDGIVAIAIAPSNPVGVDIERHRKDDLTGAAQRMLHEHERAQLAAAAPDDWNRQFLRVWTLKEAVSKCLGRGFALDFRSFAVTADPPRLATAPPELAGAHGFELDRRELELRGRPLYLAVATSDPGPAA